MPSNEIKVYCFEEHKEETISGLFAIAYKTLGQILGNSDFLFNLAAPVFNVAKESAKKLLADGAKQKFQNELFEKQVIEIIATAAFFLVCWLRKRGKLAKLYFRYGTMGSAKTLNLLAVRHNYEQQGKRVLLIKPTLDSRFGVDVVKSRAGLEYKADLLVEPNTVLDRSKIKGLACILVDEAQFLSGNVIEQLREITRVENVPIIAYGLRTDFTGHLFPGSKRLLELADSIEELKTTCRFCNKKAVFNLRHDAVGNAITDGPTIQVGGDELYSPVCYSCYVKKKEQSKKENGENHFFKYDKEKPKHFFKYEKPKIFNKKQESMKCEWYLKKAFMLIEGK